MRLRRVDHVVHPAGALLHAQVAPLRLGHQMSLRHMFGQIRWQDNMPAGRESALCVNKQFTGAETQVERTCIQSCRRSTSLSIEFDRPALRKARKPEVN